MSRSKRAARRRTARSVWQPIFLAELARTSNVASSARMAKVDSGTVYKARRSEASFHRAWQEALAEGYDNLEMEMVRRLRVGELAGGGAAKAHRKFDNAVAFRLLAAHREAVGRQKGLRANEDEDAILASINAKLEKMRERQLALEAVGKAELDDGPVDDSLRGADDAGE